MDDDKALFSILQRARLLDRSEDLRHGDVLYPFALEELLCRQVGEGAAPIIHIWRHPRAFVMGLRDSRLPHAAEAKHALERGGYSVAVRNSGGAAVPLDEGVVNVTMIVPKAEGTIDFRTDFERMYRFTERILRERSGVAKGEIAGSYCPGDYDLSVNGRKFCGIAQRRQMRALAVQAFYVVEGSGVERAELARSFYAQAAGGVDESVAAHPIVERDAMIALAEAFGSDYTSAHFARDTTAALRSIDGGQPFSPSDIPNEEKIASTIADLRKRYDI